MFGRENGMFVVAALATVVGCLANIDYRVRQGGVDVFVR